MVTGIASTRQSIGGGVALNFVMGVGVSAAVLEVSCKESKKSM